MSKDDHYIVHDFLKMLKLESRHYLDALKICRSYVKFLNSHSNLVESMYSLQIRNNFKNNYRLYVESMIRHFETLEIGSTASNDLKLKIIATELECDEQLEKHDAEFIEKSNFYVKDEYLIKNKTLCLFTFLLFYLKRKELIN